MIQLFGFAIFVGVVLPIILGVLICLWCALKIINLVRAPEQQLLEEIARLRAENDRLQAIVMQHKVATTEWIEYD